MARKKKFFSFKKQSLTVKILISALALLMFIVFIKGFETFREIYMSNVVLHGQKTSYVCIPTGSTLEDVSNLLYEKNYIVNKRSFEWLAEKMNYRHHVHPGRYKLKNHMSNNSLIKLLRSGEQDPVHLVFNSIRTKDEFAEKIASQIEAKKEAVLDLLNDADFLSKYNFKPATVMAMFIPNTYDIYWNTSAKKFLAKMYNQYNKFWTDSRIAKAKKIGLSKVEVITLASIVSEESNKVDEMPKIAGVYINRLNKGMKLQADPTIRFALNDFTIKRVLNKDLEVKSPYNTYLYEGLPPGPICIPSLSAINSVLNYKHHNYLYFCAKEDFSGYHNFASTVPQHKQNAIRYQKALNQRNIFK